ncbi:MAG: response regulator [Planctomycetaceae bacterium]|nr:response regulator [Planctomycetaceae bacterium]
MNLTVSPLQTTVRNGAYTLISFERADSPARPEPHEIENLAEATRDHVEALESELNFTKQNLQATVEELETSNEELQATNEELLASNEELQSTNEELHSVNEELYTVNAEYQNKIDELTVLTSDMHNLLQSTEVHTIFLDKDLRIRKFTPQMAKVFHLIESDIGRQIQGFVHTLNCEDLVEKLEKVAEDGEPHEEEISNPYHEFYLLRILPYLSENKNEGVVLTLVDTTILRAAENRFKTAFDLFPYGKLLVDRSGNITLLNKNLEEMFGYTADELLGQPVELLVPEDRRKHHINLRESYSKAPFTMQNIGPGDFVWGLKKDGTRIPLDICICPIDTLEGTQFLATIINITKHQELRNSLRMQIQQRDRFLATLSHKLRNPMGAILAATSILDDSSTEIPEVKEPCKVIRRQATQLATLLDDLLDVSRVTQGKVRLRCKPTNLVEVCHDALEAVNPQIEVHQHSCTIDLPPKPVWVSGDKIRLIQIIQNLLSNAIKYTSDKGMIDLSLTTNDEQAVLLLRDNGFGMTSDFIRNVFDLFVQAERTLDRSDGGMGVGLTLVKTLVELHKGSIEAHSDGLGKGSIFTVRLPLTEERTNVENKDRPESSRPEDLSIVLIEDNDDVREMMKELLKYNKYDLVGTANNGKSGLKMIMEYKPDAVLLDIGLPEMNGYQVAQNVRKELGTGITLIALTGYGSEEDHQNTVEAGFDEHLVKPINITQLKSALHLAQTRKSF